MPNGTKIATCCYCGTRAALVLRGKDRHELSCSACGAPLHDLKMLRSDKAQAKSGKKSGSNASLKKKVGDFSDFASMKDLDRKYSGSKKKKKKRKTLTKRFFEEAFDVLDDIFD